MQPSRHRKKLRCHDTASRPVARVYIYASTGSEWLIDSVAQWHVTAWLSGGGAGSSPTAVLPFVAQCVYTVTFNVPRTLGSV